MDDGAPLLAGTTFEFSSSPSWNTAIRTPESPPSAEAVVTPVEFLLVPLPTEATLFELEPVKVAEVLVFPAFAAAVPGVPGLAELGLAVFGVGAALLPAALLPAPVGEFVALGTPVPRAGLLPGELQVPLEGV